MINAVGYEIRKKDGIGFNASYLSRLCKPKTVIDVGVGNGTHELYRAFPDAQFILIEPVREFQSSLDAIRREFKCRIYQKAVSNKPGTMEISVNSLDPQLSSFKDRPPSASILEKRQVEVTTLDTILAENKDIELPLLLKVDTEGYELEVLEGARQMLAVAEMVILEVSISKRFENSYTFEDLILFMKQHGFSVFDFLTVCYAKGKPGANLTDIAFKRSAK
jgi:FkbM family methyltransferase